MTARRTLFGTSNGVRCAFRHTTFQLYDYQVVLEAIGETLNLMNEQIEDVSAAVGDITAIRHHAPALFGKNDVREHYDMMSIWYRLFWGDHLHHGWFRAGEGSPKKAQVEMLKRCAEMVGIRPGSSVIDVGCGYGGTSIYLASEFGCNVEGLSISPKQLRVATRNSRHANVSALVRFNLQDAEAFEYPPDRYDFAWTMESSEHFVNKYQYCYRLRDSLRSNGRLLLAAWTGSMTKARVAEVARRFVCPELYTAREYVDCIEAAGMQVYEVVNATSFVVPTWEICLHRIERVRRLSGLFPLKVRAFSEGIAVILGAYRSGDLTYTILTAGR